MELLTEFVDSVLIIDDKDEEVEDLKLLLEKKDLYVVHEHPASLLLREKIHRKDLVFLDFMLDDENSFRNILSKFIRPIFEKHFKAQYPYGIVLWTKHEDYVEDFYERLNTDTLINKKYTSPLFIVSLDKTKYLKKGDYSTIFEDIETELSNSFSASFFIKWKSKIASSIYTSVSDIFHLAGDYKTQDDDVRRIIYKLAVNKVGVPNKEIKKYIDNNSLSSDAYKAFDDLLYSNLNNQNDEKKNLFSGYSLSGESFRQQIKDAASINSKIFLDFNIASSNIVVPGNVYKVVGKNEYLNNGFPKDSTKIAIKLSPPCDFSQNKKKHSKLVGGFIKEIKNDDMSNLSTEFDRYINVFFKADYRYLLWPVKLNLHTNYCFICFDFHCEAVLDDSDINEESKYQLIFRAKQSLFADILQKYSSNKARLGISALLPEFPEKNT